MTDPVRDGVSLLHRATRGLGPEVVHRFRNPGFRRDTLWSIGQIGAYSALGAMQAIAVGRHFGYEPMGYVSLIVLAPTIAGWLLSLGMTHGAMYLAGASRSRIDQLLTSSAVGALALGSVAAAIAWWSFSSFLGLPEVRLAFAIGVLAIPLLLMRETFGGALVGSHNVALYSKAALLARLTSVGIVIAATYTAPLALFYPLISVAQVTSHLIVIGAVAAHFRWRWRWDTATAVTQLRYGLRSHLGGISEIGALRFDQFVLFAWLGAAGLGLYSAAVFVAETLSLFAYATTLVTFGRLSTAPANDVRRLTELTLASVSLALLVFALPLWLFAEPLLVLLFGPGFAPAATALRILVLAAVIQGTGRVATSALRALGHPLVSSIVYVLGLIVGIPLVLWLVPAAGIEGAAIASLGAYLLTTVAAVAWLALAPPQLARSARPDTVVVP